MKFFIPALLDFLNRQDILMFICTRRLSMPFQSAISWYTYHICSVILHGIHQDTMSCLGLLQLVVNTKAQQNYVSRGI